jgi:hypothetical protein
VCLFFSNTQNARHFVLQENIKMSPSVQANGKTKKKRRNTKQKTKGENTKRLATTAGLLLPRAFSPCLNLMEFRSVDLKKTVMDNCCTYNSASLLNAKDVQDFCTFSIFFSSVMDKARKLIFSVISFNRQLPKVLFCN